MLKAGLSIQDNSIGGGDEAVEQAESALIGLGYSDVSDFIGIQYRALKALRAVETLVELEHEPGSTDIQARAKTLVRYFTRDDLELAWSKRDVLRKHRKKLESLGVTLPF